LAIKNEIILEDDIKVEENATLFFCLPSVGLLGPIIGNTLIDQISDLKQIGFIKSDNIPPMTVFYDGILKHPFRLYYSQKYNIALALCEVPLESTSAYDGLSNVICQWGTAEDVKIKEIVTFQGILNRGIIKEHEIFYAAGEEKPKFLEKSNIKKLERGIISGPEATVLNRALMSKIKAYAIITDVSQYPTPEGAAKIIEKLNEIYDLNIDTEKLIEQGKNIKNKMLELAEKAQQYQQKQTHESREGNIYSQLYQ